MGLLNLLGSSRSDGDWKKEQDEDEDIGGEVADGYVSSCPSLCWLDLQGSIRVLI